MEGGGISLTDLFNQSTGFILYPKSGVVVYDGGASDEGRHWAIMIQLLQDHEEGFDS